MAWEWNPGCLKTGSSQVMAYKIPIQLGTKSRTLDLRLHSLPSKSNPKLVSQMVVKNGDLPMVESVKKNFKTNSRCRLLLKIVHDFSIAFIYWSVISKNSTEPKRMITPQISGMKSCSTLANQNPSLGFLFFLSRWTSPSSLNKWTLLVMYRYIYLHLP